MNTDVIPSAILLIDVHCYDCQKLMALSNAIEDNGRYYCEKCLPFDPDEFLKNLQNNDLTSK